MINLSLKLSVVGLAMAGLSLPTFSETSDPFKLNGDVGFASYKTPAITSTTESSRVWLPYVYADYGNLYARVDTFGYKLAPMGAGHLELTTRLSFEGYQSDVAGIGHRSRPKPVGFGTFQETSYGAFIVYAFRDAVSGGSLLDASYAAEFAVGKLHLYPQLGVERRDHKYVEKLYGISSVESQLSGLSAYSAGNSVSPNAAIALEYPLADRFKLTMQIRKRWLDQAIYESPLVNTHHQVSSVIAISKTFD